MSTVTKPPRLRVLVRPMYPEFLGNKLFSYSHVFSNRWMEPYVLWKQRSAERGMDLDTWDIHPLESADVVVIQDLPSSRQDVIRAKAQAPGAKFVLMLIESPLGRPHVFRVRNHADFDCVITYNWRLCDERRYFRYYLPIGNADLPLELAFSDRRPLVMINTNRRLGPMGLFAFRHPGLGGLPGIGCLFRDWQVGLGGLAQQANGELYSRRRSLARLADAEFPGLLDVFGPGWSGEPAGWIDKLIKPKPFACARGPSGKKDDLLPRYRFGLAFENMIGDVGYISEKIFDALLAGVVPLYLGDVRIAEHVDPACFIDARRFDSDRDLFRFVCDCPEIEWRRFRDAGQKYLASDAAKKFQSEAFARRMVDVLEIAAKKST